MEDTEKVEKAEVQPTEENPKEEIEQEEVIEVKGKDIVINGEVYDPERALELIKKQRGFEKDLNKAIKKVELYEQKEKERKEADLTEKEKAELRAEKAEKELAELRLKGQRRDAAAKAGLPDILIDRIKGETPEEMEEDAKSLITAIPKQKSNVGITNPGQNALGKEETRAETLRRLGL
jgi:hypothetical protein